MNTSSKAHIPPPAGATRPAGHAIGDASAASPGTGTDTAGSSDWLAERIIKPQDTPQGVPLSSGHVGGQATESKRGQR